MHVTMWERDEGDRLRTAIARKAAAGARQRLRELRGPATTDEATPAPEAPAEPIEEIADEEPVELTKPTAAELAVLLDTEDDREWRKGVSDILKAFGENRRRLVSHQRDLHIVECRHAVAQYLRNRGWSFPRIGQFMGRDHSSIVHLLNPEKRRERYYIKVREAAVLP
jgi:hypothetical protein